MQSRGEHGLDQALRGIEGVTRVTPIAAGAFRIHAEHDVRTEVVAATTKLGAPLLGLTMMSPSLDDVYTEYFRAVVHAA